MKCSIFFYTRFAFKNDGNNSHSNYAGIQIRYFLSNNAESSQDLLQSIKLPRLENFQSDSNDETGVRITGSAKAIFQELVRRSIPTVGFTYFSAEGQNDIEGIELAQIIETYCSGLLSKQMFRTQKEHESKSGQNTTLRVPLAWSSLYGPPPDRSLYT